MTLTFPRITIAFGLDSEVERFNLFRVYIGPPNPIIDGCLIKFVYTRTFGLSISFKLYCRLRGFRE